MIEVKRKVTIVGDKWGFFEIEDCSTEYKYLIENEGKEFADSYYRPGKFAHNELDELNGSHFLFGYLESFVQSDRCPVQYQLSKTPCCYIVEVVQDDITIPLSATDKQMLTTAHELLLKTYEQSQQFLESLTEETVQHPKVMKIHQHYWVSNLKIETISDLLDILKN